MTQYNWSVKKHCTANQQEICIALDIYFCGKLSSSYEEYSLGKNIYILRIKFRTRRLNQNIRAMSHLQKCITRQNSVTYGLSNDIHSIQPPPLCFGLIEQRVVNNTQTKERGDTEYESYIACGTADKYE